MEEKDKVKIVVALAAGLIFVIGFGIGVQLYESTSPSDRGRQTSIQSLHQRS